jgi:WD repeat-containing protein 68
LPAIRFEVPKTTTTFRNLEHSTVLYETENNPLVKLAWNKLDSNYLAVIEMDEKFVTLLDTRYPQVPLTKLRNHKDVVNAIAWAPQSSTHICSVADDSIALIWDLSDIQNKSEQQRTIYQSIISVHIPTGSVP